MAGTEKENQAVRWGGLLVVVGVIGGVIVGFNLPTIALSATGVITVVVGLVVGNRGTQ